MRTPHDVTHRLQEPDWWCWAATQGYKNSLVGVIFPNRFFTSHTRQSITTFSPYLPPHFHHVWYAFTNHQLLGHV
jgi:hypothetical protein